MSLFTHHYPAADGVSERLEIAIRQIEFARSYTLTLLDDLTTDEWFWIPGGYSTHVAWQVGHLAMSEYGLTLFQQRGRDREVDAELMSSAFRKRFMRGTVPQVDRDQHPTPDEILAVLARVHDRMRVEVPGFDGAPLDEHLGPPTAAYATRYGALLFAAHHEMIHAGQIGMLRRLMGKPPLR